MSHKRSGFTVEQRESFLKECGFVFIRHGKGSHDIWEHPEMKALARDEKSKVPDNILNQKAVWEITLSSDPAFGTWTNIRKQAIWVNDHVRQAVESSAHTKARCNLLRQFRESSTEIRNWKRTVKHELKLGQTPTHAPDSYYSFEHLKDMRNTYRAALQN